MKVNNPTFSFILSQLCLFGSILMCAIMLPDGLSMNKGISYFSSRGLTIIPYSLGLLGCAWFVYKTGQILATQGVTRIGRWTMVISVLMVIVTLFPFAINETLRSLHRVFSASLFLTQLAFTVWMTMKWRNDTTNVLLILSLVAIIIGTLFYLSPVLRILIVGEVSFQLVFALICYRTFFERSPKRALAPQT